MSNNRRIVSSHVNVNPAHIIISFAIPGETFNAFAAANAKTVIRTQGQADQARAQIIADAQAQDINPFGARAKNPSAVDSGAAQMQIKQCGPLAQFANNLDRLGYTLSEIEVIKDEATDRTKLRLHFSDVPDVKAPADLFEKVKPWVRCSWRVCYVWHNPHADSVTINCDDQASAGAPHKNVLQAAGSADSFTISVGKADR